jgi:protein-S-isoprenylcysteine O-methyltransferase Ste14
VLNEATIRTVAAGMAGADVAAMLLALRWQRGGREAILRADFHGRGGRGGRILSITGDVALIAVLLYPAFVVLVGYLSWDTATWWSGPLAGGIQIVGIVVWGVGLILWIWSAHTLGRYLAIDGVAVDHELLTRGPYARIRHPFYAASIWIGLGVALAFLSRLALGLGVLIASNAFLWASLEERLLASPAGFGTAYEEYAGRTGRFLPRLRHLARP